MRLHRAHYDFKHLPTAVVLPSPSRSGRGRTCSAASWSYRSRIQMRRGESRSSPARQRPARVENPGPAAGRNKARSALAVGPRSRPGHRRRSAAVAVPAVDADLARNFYQAHLRLEFAKLRAPRADVHERGGREDDPLQAGPVLGGRRRAQADLRGDSQRGTFPGRASQAALMSCGTQPSESVALMSR